MPLVTAPSFRGPRLNRQRSLRAVPLFPRASDEESIRENPLTVTTFGINLVAISNGSPSRSRPPPFRR